MDEIKIAKVVDEAARILKDYPHLKYVQAIQKAKEVLGRGSDTGNQFNNN